MQTTFLLSDVFGVTDSLKKLSLALNNVEIIDPYEGQVMNFPDEAAAYKYFSDYIGLARYVEHLANIIAKSNTKETSITSESTIADNIYLVGFSVGASAIWHYAGRAAGNLPNNYTFNGICFYGSQIRNATAKIPRFNLELIFPKEESHFDVDKTIAELTGHRLVSQRVLASKSNYLHGFMNECSVNYNAEAYTQYLALLKTRTQNSLDK